MKTMVKVFVICALMSGVSFAQESKNQADSGNSVAPLFGGNGGPDAFGYTFSGSVAGNCAFQFVDISATGASVVVGDDVASAPIPLQGLFNFYGVDLPDIVMASNGFLSTDPVDTGGDLSNDCPLPVIPSTGGGARIYPLHDDLNLVAGTGDGLFQYFSTCPRPSQVAFGDIGCHVFQWDEVSHFGGAEVFDLQAILYDDTFEIVFQHDDRNIETGSGSTTGIQNDGATDGLTFACNVADSIPANSAQCFFHPFPNILPPPAVPTMTTWGMIVLALVLMLLGSVIMRRRAS